jgi:hypothetical protein
MGPGSRFWAAHVESLLSGVAAHRPLYHAFVPPADLPRRCRQFPALTACTTLDWFCPWPADALASVAQRALADVPALAAGCLAGEGAGPGGLARAAATLAVEVHIGVQATTERFFREQRRRWVRQSRLQQA